MRFTVSFKALLGMVFTLAFFWETLSVFGSHGEFSPFHFEANSERFLLFVPAVVILWLLRHLLPNRASNNDINWQGD